MVTISAGVSRSIFAALLFVSFSSSAQTCTPPAPLTDLGSIQGSSEWLGAAGTVCDLRTSIQTGGRWAASAYARGTLDEPRRRVRASFHVDFSGLAAFTPLQSTTLLRLVAATTPAQPVKSATIAQFAIGRTSGSGGELAYLLAPTAGSGGTTLFQNTALPSRSIDVALEATIGTPGVVRYWIDNDFNAPPTASLAVDNAAWTAIAGMAFGEFSNMPSFLASQGDRDIVFSDIKIDEYLFWDHFD